MSGGQPYSPHNYDEKFEGMITLRRALEGSRNVPAVKLADKIGMNSVIDMARRFGITSPLPPYLPVTLGAADLNLLEHTSAFTVFPDDGIRIDPHMIRRVTSYDGALLEQAHPAVHDVIEPDVARTMTAMLEDVVQFGTGMAARALGRPAGGKTGTTNDFTDAWFIGFTPEITAGVWVGYDDKAVLLSANPRPGAIAALPIWLQFMQGALAGKPVETFQNVVPLEKVALTKTVIVDTPDSAPTEGGETPVTRDAAPENRPASRKNILRAKLPPRSLRPRTILPRRQARVGEAIAVILAGRTLHLKRAAWKYSPYPPRRNDGLRVMGGVRYRTSRTLHFHSICVAIFAARRQGVRMPIRRTCEKWLACISHECGLNLQFVANRMCPVARKREVFFGWHRLQSVRLLDARKSRPHRLKPVPPIRAGTTLVRNAG